MLLDPKQCIKVYTGMSKNYKSLIHDGHKVHAHTSYLYMMLTEWRQTGPDTE